MEITTETFDQEITAGIAAFEAKTEGNTVTITRQRDYTAHNAERTRRVLVRILDIEASYAGGPTQEILLRVEGDEGLDRYTVTMDGITKGIYWAKSDVYFSQGDITSKVAWMLTQGARPKGKRN